MSDEQIVNSAKMHRIISEGFASDTIVPLKDLVRNISRVSNVRVRDRSVEHYYELGIDAINDEGILQIPESPKKFGAANESAIKSQCLHRGDVIFGYRGKMGRVGLVKDEFEIPVVTNNGMIRITFDDNRLEETPRYVQTYLQSKLVSTYLNSMLEDRNGVSVLNVDVVENLPIPYFEEMEGLSKLSTLFERRRSVVLAVRNIIKEAQALLLLSEDMETESISLQSLPVEQLSKINQGDHNRENAMKDLLLNLQRLQQEQPTSNILLKNFSDLKS